MKYPLLFTCGICGDTYGLSRDEYTPDNPQYFICFNDLCKGRSLEACNSMVEEWANDTEPNNTYLKPQGGKTMSCNRKVIQITCTKSMGMSSGHTTVKPKNSLAVNVTGAEPTDLNELEQTIVKALTDWKKAIDEREDA